MNSVNHYSGAYVNRRSRRAMRKQQSQKLHHYYRDSWQRYLNRCDGDEYHYSVTMIITAQVQEPSKGIVLK